MLIIAEVNGLLINDDDNDDDDEYGGGGDTYDDNMRIFMAMVTMISLSL
jgi:hypothetical protein